MLGGSFFLQGSAGQPLHVSQPEDLPLIPNPLHPACLGARFRSIARGPKKKAHTQHTPRKHNSGASNGLHMTPMNSPSYRAASIGMSLFLPFARMIYPLCRATSCPMSLSPIRPFARSIQPAVRPSEETSKLCLSPPRSCEDIAPWRPDFRAAMAQATDPHATPHRCQRSL